MTQDNSDAHGGYDIFRDALHLSGNPTTPPAILDQVARGSVQAPNPGARVRRAKATWTVWNVANNPSTAPATLQWIADTCPSDSIVTDVLKHPDTPREVLDRFAGKRKRFYHAYLARNTGAGDEFLRALLDAHPRDSEVVSRIMANPSIKRFQARRTPSVRAGVSVCPAEGLPCRREGSRWFPTYRFTTSRAAPPVDTAQYDGDQK